MSCMPGSGMPKPAPAKPPAKPAAK
jgi:hypothetical protein